MLVEDDNNLREIYEARLLAEGYDIVSAKDGEEALATAVKEKPDLIISDVMMPKISGFDMLDILRSTPETKNTKVIMMTALSQAEDKARADKLGADRYLVKSQVTLEDVAKVAREVLSGEEPAANDPTVPSVAAATAAPAPTPTADPVVTTAAPVADEPAATPDPTPATDTTTPDPAATANPTVDPALAEPEADEKADIEEQIKEFENLPVAEAPAEEAPATDTASEPATAEPSATVITPDPVTPTPEEPATSDTVDVAGKKVIEPIAAEPKPDINELAAKEDAKDAETKPGEDPGSVAL